MIGLIRGILLEKQSPQLVIDVNGIGYEIDAPMSTFYQLPEVGGEISLFTHFVVREDAQVLFGFYTREERTLFRNLLRVNGIGPKVALTILSSTSPADFVRSILNNDMASLIRIPGIGKKTAERLMIEMRDKLSDWYQAASTATLPSQHIGKTNDRRGMLQDAIAALMSLGYRQQEATRMVTKIDDGTSNSEALIRLALKEQV